MDTENQTASKCSKIHCLQFVLSTVKPLYNDLQVTF